MNKNYYLPTEDIGQLAKAQRVIKTKDKWKISQVGKIQDKNINSLNKITFSKKVIFKVLCILALIAIIVAIYVIRR